MKLLMILGAVLLSTVTAKVQPDVPEVTTKVITVQIPLQVPNTKVHIPNDVEEAHVVQIPGETPVEVSSTTAPEISSNMPNDLTPRTVMMDTTKVVQKRSLIPTTKKMLTLNNPGQCDVLCTKFDLNPVCATNGICVHEFPNQCVLDTYNCENPQMRFRVVRIDRCKRDGRELCDESDLRGNDQVIRDIQRRIMNN